MERFYKLSPQSLLKINFSFSLLCHLDVSLLYPLGLTQVKTYKFEALNPLINYKKINNYVYILHIICII